MRDSLNAISAALSVALLVALAYMIINIGVCYTVHERERNGNHQTNLDGAHVPGTGWLRGYTRRRQATLPHLAYR